VPQIPHSVLLFGRRGLEMALFRLQLGFGLEGGRPLQDSG